MKFPRPALALCLAVSWATGGGGAIEASDVSLMSADATIDAPAGAAPDGTGGAAYCDPLVDPVGGCTGPNVVQCGPLLPFCVTIPGAGWSCCTADHWVNGEPCEIVGVMCTRFQTCECFGCPEGGSLDGGTDAEPAADASDVAQVESGPHDGSADAETSDGAVCGPGEIVCPVPCRAPPETDCFAGSKCPPPPPCPP